MTLSWKSVLKAAPILSLDFFSRADDVEKWIKLSAKMPRQMGTAPLMSCVVNVQGAFPIESKVLEIVGAHTRFS